MPKKKKAGKKAGEPEPNFWADVPPTVLTAICQVVDVPQYDAIEPAREVGAGGQPLQPSLRRRGGGCPRAVVPALGRLPAAARCWCCWPPPAPALTQLRLPSQADADESEPRPIFKQLPGPDPEEAEAAAAEAEPEVRAWSTLSVPALCSVPLVPHRRSRCRARPRCDTRPC